jgi:dTDP-4-amino-4,6-dideoxygalactose transaminase
VKISLVVPCFNEVEGVPQLAAALEDLRTRLAGRHELELVFVDDGSTDGTGDALRGGFAAWPAVRLLTHAENRGLGAALRTAFAAATGDWIATCDSDCTYDPRELPAMIALLENGADVVVASPYHPAGGVRNVPRSRLFLSRNLSRLYDLVLGKRVYTYTSLFRLYRGELVRDLAFESDGFLSMAELLVGALRRNAVVVEYPTILAVRHYGASKAAVARLIIQHVKFLARLTRDALVGRRLVADARPATKVLVIDQRPGMLAGAQITRRAMTPSMSLPRDDDSTGRDLGDAEIELLTRVIRSGCLTSTKGTMVKNLEAGFARLYGAGHCVAMSSGTAALHAAIAAVDPEPGDEIVTTPITDMGAITPILYQGAIPIFADVDPDTYNVTADTIAPRITKRTRAIMVTHLFGNPADMGPILDLARHHGVPVIEDCSQAYFAEYRGRRVGTLGAIGCFSLQQGKHMTCGEGGLVITEDAAIARRLRLFTNKAWGYGDPAPDHYFLALNYRMTELQGAVALAQLDKVVGVVERRRAVAGELARRLAGIPGLGLPVVTRDGVHSYWKFPVQVDEEVMGVDVVRFAKQLSELGVVAQPRYIQKPAFECEVLRERRTFGGSSVPFRGLKTRDDEVRYDRAEYPATLRALSRILVMPLNEFFRTEHIAFIAEAVHEAAERCRRARA